MPSPAGLFQTVEAVGFIAVVAVLLIGGVASIIIAIRNAVRGYATRNWQRVPGRILRSFVLVYTGDDGKGCTATVEYEYRAADGSAYKGTRLRFGHTGSWTRARAERLLAPFPPGATVDVFFDPGRPADAVLVRGVSLGNTGIFLAGVAFLSVAWAMLFRR